jgi:hypothetical protein
MANQEDVESAIQTLDNVAGRTQMSRQDHMVAHNAITLLRGFSMAVFTAAQVEASEKQLSDPSLKERDDAESRKNSGVD